MDILKSQRVNLLTLKEGEEITRKNQKKSTVKESKLEKNWNKFECGITNICDLHETCSNLIGTFIDEIDYVIVDYDTNDTSKNFFFFNYIYINFLK